MITTPAYRLMEATDQFYNPTTAPNQLWQTDFTAPAVPVFQDPGAGVGIISRQCWMITAPAALSRYILAWELCPGMQATDVERTMQAALKVSSLKSGQRPRMLSDNGSAYVSR
ncbi:transposase family protein [Spirosoma sp. BT702]|uniref:Transposase family protein n=1 Tax=Spirosoma profusum TaxID=2771354 RepID=A0A927GAV7_9BACT|nr:DDE-type integrase/transposase/recombinase [Spirosoma profusum]MBD2705831.1 transposase family protein [Spirosoma profusum]